MSAIAVTPVYNTFLDVDGNPVDDGYVWIGQPNLNPIANPQNAYWDEALTQLVTQPVRTRQGYPLNGSSVGKLYVAGGYSILVRNENGSDVIGAATFSADYVIDDLTLTGNLAFSGTAQRITGDFSNATLASRVYFQSSTANGNTGIGALPNGTATTATFTVFNTSDPANSSVGQLAATSTDIRAVSTVTGTGSAVPFKVFVGGGEQVRIGGDSTLRSLGSFAVNTPPLINAATYTTLGTDFSLRFSTTNCTITLPAAATYPGRILIITNVTANSVTSDASNVKPLGSDVAGTTILSASAGKFAFLQSDGSFWITLMAN